MTRQDVARTASRPLNVPTGAAGRRMAPAPREEQCEGCQRLLPGHVMRNVRVGDDTFRVLCPSCINEGVPDGR